MATNIFISFRASDGIRHKEELDVLFKSDISVRNFSEDKDRSDMSDSTIQSYLYSKLKETSLTIVILTPNAVNHKKNGGKYDDWMYDELKYSLDDRTDNRTNAVIALYTTVAEDYLYTTFLHECRLCGEKSIVHSINNFDNLVRRNMLNIYPEYKKNKCVGIYDSLDDSYISLVYFEDFKSDYSHYIESALEKRNRLNEFDLKKRLD